MPMSLDEALSIVSEGRAYTVEHYGFTKDKFVGHFKAETYERAVDLVVRGTHELLTENERMRVVLERIAKAPLDNEGCTWAADQARLVLGPAS